MGMTESGTNELLARLNPRRFRSRVAQALSEALTEGKQSMVDKIETGGTGETWSRPWGASGRTASAPGRDDTGAMKSAVQGPETIEETDGGATGYLGWPEGSPEYFRHQEHGFYSVIARRDVEEMRALRDAADETTISLTEKLKKIGDLL